MALKIHLNALSAVSNHRLKLHSEGNCREQPQWYHYRPTHTWVLWLLMDAVASETVQYMTYGQTSQRPWQRELFSISGWRKRSITN